MDIWYWIWLLGNPYIVLCILNMQLDNLCVVLVVDE